MYYLFFNFLAFSCVFLIDSKLFSKYSKLLIFLLFVFFVSFLPSLQYDVGHDYFNYIEIYKPDGQLGLDLYFNKGEYFFYYSVIFLRYFDLPPQSLFVYHSVICSLLISICLYKLEIKKYKISLIFLLFFLITGMMHNQLNGLRVYLAAYFFLSSFIMKISGNTFWSILFAFLGLFCHQSFLAVAFLLLIPSSFYVLLGHNARIMFFLFLFIWSSGIVISIISFLINFLLPGYSHYLAVVNNPVPIFNIITKLYYLPFVLLFLYRFKNISKKFSDFDMKIIGLWVLTSTLYLSLLHSGLVFRALHYFVFFSIIPLYWLIISFNKNLSKLICVFFLLLPYAFKVIIFPYGEYDYQSIIFQ